MNVVEFLALRKVSVFVENMHAVLMKLSDGGELILNSGAGLFHRSFAFSCPGTIQNHSVDHFLSPQVTMFVNDPPF